MLTREWAPGRYRVTVRNPALPHQIVISLTGCAGLAVSCNCQRRPGGGTPAYRPLETRDLWEPGEAIAAWRTHLGTSC